MIFFYQIRTLKHKTVPCPDLICSLCGSRGGIEIGIYQKYAWLLMPMWPEHKFGLAVCNHCHQPIPNLKWTDELEDRYHQIKKETATPLRLWRGLLINPLLMLAFLGVIAGIIFILARNSKHKQAESKVLIAQYIAEPKAGDLYKVAILESGPPPGYNYTYFRYTGMSGDTLFVQQLKKGSNMYGDWDKLDTREPNAFKDKKIPLSHPIFKQNQDFMIFGEQTIHLFFKGIERGDEVADKN